MSRVIERGGPRPDPEPAAFIPQRGDAVETWLIRFRDALAPSSECVVVDELLTEYRAAAESGVPLTGVVSFGDL